MLIGILKTQGATMQFCFLFSTTTIIFTISIFVVSTIVGFLTEKYRKKRFKNEKNSALMILLHPISCIVAFLIVQLFYNPNKTFQMQTLQLCSLFIILLHASYCDIKEREVDDYISIMLMLVGLFGLNLTTFATAIEPFLGALICFVLFFIVLVTAKSVPIGGADIKIATACALTLGAFHGLLAILFGLIFALVGTAVKSRIKKEKQKSFPFIPYYFAGVIVSLLLPFESYLFPVV